MHYEVGFDNRMYLELQSAHIRERISQFGGKLYLEFGGKLFDDNHAARVLPGFEPDSKVKMLLTMKEQAEIVMVINAEDIEKNKVRGDLGITYDLDLLRLIDAFQGIGLYVGSVVITQADLYPTSAERFRARLEGQGVRVYRHYAIPNYPYDVEHIVSAEGFGRNEYVETSRPLVVVTAPGPGSGKMATCLSQLYHEHLRGVSAGYAKFETFPIWNLPLKHPVNLAYEAATTDLNDVNMIDPFHLEAYGVTTVNYNRDVDNYPLMQAIFESIFGTCPYKSPTDMGVNMAGNCIIDNEAVIHAANKEIVRRWYDAACAYRKDSSERTRIIMQKNESVMKQAGQKQENRKVAMAARAKGEETGEPAAAMELCDGQVITGRTSLLLGASSALLLNALKVLAGIPDEQHLISPAVIQPIQRMKTELLGGSNPRLHTDEVLVALSVCAVTDPDAARAIAQLPNLKHTEVHSTVLLSQVDEATYKKLGANITCDPVYQSKKLYHKV